MKKYIRADATKEQETVTMTFEVFFVVQHGIAAAISMKNGKYYITVNNGNRQIEKDIEEEFYDFVRTILGKIESYGFYELDSAKSPYSDSLYFTFCYESEHRVTKVNTVFYLRVSDHDLPDWGKDISQKDLKKKHHTKNALDAEKRYRTLNVSLPDDQKLNVVDSYVRYDGKISVFFDVVMDDVDRRLRYLLRKHRPTE